MRNPLIAGNWKMYMTCAQATELMQKLKNKMGNEARSSQVMIAPPFTALDAVGSSMDGTGWYLGAQNTFWEDEGAYTGEISPLMLRDTGCRFVIVGHSERRQHFGETDADVCRKARAVLGHEMTPIICIGESQSQRDREETFDVIERQLKEALNGFEDPEEKELIIAYEPIWAIGTGKTASPGEAQEVHSAIRRWMDKHISEQRAERTRILYGGSVKPDNIQELMAEGDIDGALVGGASLNADSFAEIIRLA